MLKLYTTPTCPKCELAKAKLKEMGVTYEVVCDVEKAINLGLKAVPCLISDSGKRYGLKDIISVSKGDGSFE